MTRTSQGSIVPRPAYWRCDVHGVRGSLGDLSLSKHYERCSVVWEPAETPSTLALMPLDDQTTRELSRAAANVRTWTEKRNTLIRQAFEAGAGVREIAKATGLNVGTVHTMLHGRKR